MKPGAVLIGIDLGTTVLKICALDAKTGAVLGHAQQRLPVHILADGGREQEVRAVDRAFTRVARAVQRQAGDRWRKAEGIGLAAQGGSSIIANVATGAPLTPMMLWNDTRGEEDRRTIQAQTSERFWLKHLLAPEPPAGLGRLRWLRKTRPDLFRDGRIHVGAGEHLFFELTGVWRQDPGNAIQIGSYDAARKRLDAVAFDLIDVPLSFVAPLREGHETAPLSKRGARWLDLPEGVPVAGPYIDQEAGYLSAAGLTDRPLQCSLGTAWVGNFALPDDTTGSSPFQLVLPAPVGAGRLVVQPLLTGNVSWDWGLAALIHPHPKKALARAGEIFRERLLPPDGLIAVPWFTQRNPLCLARGGGIFWGMSSEMSRADLIRAVAAGMACELARVFQAVKARGAVDSIVLGGGACKGWFFRELIAALFAPLPVFRQEDDDFAVARGATFAFNPVAAQSNREPVSPPAPVPALSIHNAYDLYCDVFNICSKHVVQAQPFHFKERQK